MRYSEGGVVQRSRYCTLFARIMEMEKKLSAVQDAMALATSPSFGASAAPVCLGLGKALMTLVLFGMC